MAGRKNWYFADGYLPEKIGSGSMEAHEALMLFNPSPEPVAVKLNVYFYDRPPVKGIGIEVAPERVIAVRLDHPDELGGTVIPPLTQYALHVSASIPVICQFGRLDTTQNAMAYYTGSAWAE